MVMVVNERTREIGMMAALGLAPKQVLHLFLLEGTITGVLGATLGTMVGGVAAALLAREGIPLEGMGGIDSRLFIMPRMYPLLNWQVLAYALLAGTAMAALVTYLPARRAARLEPTDALRMS